MLPLSTELEPESCDSFVDLHWHLDVLAFLHWFPGHVLLSLDLHWHFYVLASLLWFPGHAWFSLVSHLHHSVLAFLLWFLCHVVPSLDLNWHHGVLAFLLWIPFHEILSFDWHQVVDGIPSQELSHFDGAPSCVCLQTFFLTMTVFFWEAFLKN